MHFFTNVMVVYLVLFTLYNARKIVSMTFPPPVLGQPLTIVKNHTMAAKMQNGLFAYDSIGLIEQHGYYAQEHVIITPDGYIIKIFRIPGSPMNPPQKGKPVVCLQHGMFSSSDIWIYVGPNRDLAFLLADQGYDVWLTNVRGNSYGRSHRKLSPDKDREFWDFSYHEYSVYDLASAIDYMLEVTGEKSLIYVGYSLGVPMGFALISVRPEYNRKIRVLACLGPIVTWRTVKLETSVQLLLNNVNLFRSILESMNFREIMRQSTMNIFVGKTCFEEKAVFQPICIALLYQWAGFPEGQFNSTIWKKAAPYIPQAVSLRGIWHFYQNYAARKFQMYDFEKPELNMAKYGRPKPPKYNLKKVTAPVALFYGKTDRLTPKEDMQDLERTLPNVVYSEAVPFNSELFNHFDYMFGQNAKPLLYDRVIDVICKYRTR